MQPLDLYAQIEQSLGFEDEIHELYKAIGHQVLSKEPKTLIDIGCGQGEFCHIMNYNGLKTYGVDLSSKQIELALLKDETLDVHCLDIKDVTQKFDCATAIFDVINYIPQSQLKYFFKYCYDVLNNHGYFIFDINSLYGFSEVATGTLNIEDDDRFIAIDADFDKDMLKTKITLFEKNKDKNYTKQNGTITQHYHSKQRIEQQLKKAGFKSVQINEFCLHSDEADKYIFVCQK